MVDKIILVVLGIEHIGFGLLGLFSPERAASLVGFDLTRLSAFSEVRAHYSLFLVIGIMSFLALRRMQLQTYVYQTYALIFGSYLVGRLYSLFVDGFPDSTGWIVILAELAVVLVSIWRNQKIG